jgi:integrase
MRRKRADCWSYLAGEKGRNRVRAFEHRDTRRLFLEVRDRGTRRRIALGHKDQEAAKRKADEVAATLGRNDPAPEADITFGTLFDNYLREVTPTKGDHKQRHDRRIAKMMLEIFGRGMRVSSFTHRDAARFVSERKRRGDQRVGKVHGKPIRNRILAYDIMFLRAVLNWGVNAGWLHNNPLRGFRTEREESTKRPIMSAAQFDSFLVVSGTISPLFRLALIVTNETGHRIGAVRLLKWSDIKFQTLEIRWRGENDKRNYEHVTPLTPVAAKALRKARRARALIGEGWIFPSPRVAGTPVSRHLLRDWWQRGEVAAKLPEERGRGWHSLRRKFATEMKHAPLKDLCALGGWKDHQTLLMCYQRADPVTMRTALANRIRLGA